MNIFKWIKWIFSFLILVIALTGIIWGTNYILNHKGIREVVNDKPRNIIEKGTSNESKTSLTEIYNIYLNQEKHKVKIDYQLTSKDDEEKIVNLYVYFDGKSSLEKEIISLNEIDTMHDVFLLEDIGSDIRIKETNFNIFKDEENEYLLLDLVISGDSIQRYYYLFDNDGDLMDDNGILVSDSAKDYYDINGNIFNNYYDNEKKTLAIVKDDGIYALEEKTEKKKLDLIEYKYYLEKGKLKKEKNVTFEDIKLNDK